MRWPELRKRLEAQPLALVVAFAARAAARALPVLAVGRSGEPPLWFWSDEMRGKHLDAVFRSVEATFERAASLAAGRVGVPEGANEARRAAYSAAFAADHAAFAAFAHATEYDAAAFAAARDALNAAYAAARDACVLDEATERGSSEAHADADGALSAAMNGVQAVDGCRGRWKDGDLSAAVEACCEDDLTFLDTYHREPTSGLRRYYRTFVARPLWGKHGAVVAPLVSTFVAGICELGGDAEYWAAWYLSLCAGGLLEVPNEIARQGVTVLSAYLRGLSDAQAGWDSKASHSDSDVPPSFE